MRGSGRAGFVGRHLAEEVVVFRRGQRGMRVGAVDHAERVRIHAGLLFQLQAELETRSGVSELQHLRLFRDAQIQVSRSEILGIDDVRERHVSWELPGFGGLKASMYPLSIQLKPMRRLS